LLSNFGKEGQGNLSAQIIKKFEIYIPSITEQQKKLPILIEYRYKIESEPSNNPNAEL
jgi:restriction endonuclease S subunit